MKSAGRGGPSDGGRGREVKMEDDSLFEMTESMVIAKLEQIIQLLNINPG